MQSKTKVNGTLAEVLFTAEAMKRGLHVSVPIGDNQHYDAIVDNGRKLFRIQVKSAHSMHKRNYYNINISRMVRRRQCDGNKITVTERCTNNEYDMLAAYVEPCNAWYIIPFGAPEIFNKIAINVHTDVPSQKKRQMDYDQYRENWILLSN